MQRFKGFMLQDFQKALEPCYVEAKQDKGI